MKMELEETVALASSHAIRGARYWSWKHIAGFNGKLGNPANGSQRFPPGHCPAATIGAGVRHELGAVTPADFQTPAGYANGPRSLHDDMT